MSSSKAPALNQRARVARALGEHRMIPIAKDDVIGYLAVTDWPPDRRELLYRSWCAVVGVSCLKSDLRRARQGKQREANRRLEFE